MLQGLKSPQVKTNPKSVTFSLLHSQVNLKGKMFSFEASLQKKSKIEICFSPITSINEH
jgi:hypothetical protein